MNRRLREKILPLAATLCLLLTSCGKGDTAKPFDPAATATALTASAAFSETLEAIDSETAILLYGLDSSTVTGSAVYGSLSAGAEEVAVFTLTDEKAAETTLAALKQRVEDQKTVLKDYQPEEVPKLEGALVVQRGASVLLVVAADVDAAQAALDGLDQ